MSAIRVTAEGIYPKYAGEIQDYFIEWTAQIAPARVTAASATGAWSLAGETGSALALYTAQGISGSALGLTHLWTAYNSASGAGLTATGSASALYSLMETFRISGGTAVQIYGASAELRTSSGRYLQDRFFINVGA